MQHERPLPEQGSAPGNRRPQGSRGRDMPRIVSALVLIAAFGLAAGTPAASRAGAPIPAGVDSVAPVVARITPGVVGISVKGEVREENPLAQDPLFRRFFDVPRDEEIEHETEATGSGVIVDAARGTVLTNNHVVEHATDIEVTTKDNRRFRARLIGRDPGTDIAVLRIPAENLTAVPFGDSSRLQVGDFVLAVGNPFGLGQTVTSGIISALGRTGLGIEGNEGYEDFIQTDASINPGNSGGPLVNLAGQIVGINTAILAPQGGNIGIGFAVPINMVREVMDQILRNGAVRRGHIGVQIQDLTPDLARALGTTRTAGAVIARVEPGSPAEHAGLRSSDLVVAVDGVPIANASELRNRVGMLQIGATVVLTVERNGVARAVNVSVAQLADRHQRGGER
jgi:Do/DeqQ family serine protease